MLHYTFAAGNSEQVSTSDSLHLLSRQPRDHGWLSLSPLLHTLSFSPVAKPSVSVVATRNTFTTSYERESYELLLYYMSCMTVSRLNTVDRDNSPVKYFACQFLARVVYMYIN